jgi:hypothetical protein
MYVGYQWYFRSRQIAPAEVSWQNFPLPQFSADFACPTLAEIEAY